MDDTQLQNALDELLRLAARSDTRLTAIEADLAEMKATNVTKVELAGITHAVTHYGKYVEGMLNAFAKTSLSHEEQLDDLMPLVFPLLAMLRKLWGRPHGLRGTPSSRIRNNGVSVLQGASRPTGASAAVQGDRPTIYAGAQHRKNEWHWPGNPAAPILHSTVAPGSVSRQMASMRASSAAVVRQYSPVAPFTTIFVTPLPRKNSRIAPKPLVSNSPSGRRGIRTAA